MAHLLSLADAGAADIEAILDLAARLKEQPGLHARALAGRTLLMLFAKPSLRTRLSFEVAMLDLGGHAIFFDLADAPLGAGKESIADTARSASRYVDAIMARLFRHDHLEELARRASVPVINGLTNSEHPCQALGDLFTLRERKGRLAGLTLAYLGDARNNVTHSLLDGCAAMGVSLSIACPPDERFRPSAERLERARAKARASGARIEVHDEPLAAVRGSDAVYTDSWMSYHIPPRERGPRQRALEPFRVTQALLRAAARDAIFLHCLPAQRGAEVTAEVIDGAQSVVFDQAENRLHVQKAVLLRLLGAAPGAARVYCQP